MERGLVRRHQLLRPGGHVLESRRVLRVAGLLGGGRQHRGDGAPVADAPGPLALVHRLQRGHLDIDGVLARLAQHPQDHRGAVRRRGPERFRGQALVARYRPLQHLAHGGQRDHGESRRDVDLHPRRRPRQQLLLPRRRAGLRDPSALARRHSPHRLVVQHGRVDRRHPRRVPAPSALAASDRDARHAPGRSNGPRGDLHRCGLDALLDAGPFPMGPLRSFATSMVATIYRSRRHRAGVQFQDHAVVRRPLRPVGHLPRDPPRRGSPPAAHPLRAHGPRRLPRRQSPLHRPESPRLASRRGTARQRGLDSRRAGAHEPGHPRRPAGRQDRTARPRRSRDRRPGRLRLRSLVPLDEGGFRLLDARAVLHSRPLLRHLLRILLPRGRGRRRHRGEFDRAAGQRMATGVASLAAHRRSRRQSRPVPVLALRARAQHERRLDLPDAGSLVPVDLAHRQPRFPRRGSPRTGLG